MHDSAAHDLQECMGEHRDAHTHHCVELPPATDQLLSDDPEELAQSSFSSAETATDAATRLKFYSEALMQLRQIHGSHVRIIL